MALNLLSFHSENSLGCISPNSKSYKQKKGHIFFVCLVGFFFLTTLHNTWDLSTQSRDQICVPCIGSMESEPLDHQGIPLGVYFSFNPGIAQELDSKIASSLGPQ